jgi:hypothetical protein
VSAAGNDETTGVFMAQVNELSAEAATSAERLVALAKEFVAQVRDES